MSIKFYAKWAVSTLFGALHAHSYCAEWDAALSRLIDAHQHEAELGPGGCTLRLGEYQVWVENAYYSYGSLYGYGASAEFRPSLTTMSRLDQIVRSLQSERREADKREHQEKMMRIGMEASK